MIKAISKIYRGELEFFLRSLSGIFIILACAYFLFALAGLAFSLGNPALAQGIYAAVKAGFESKGFFAAGGNFGLFVLIFLNNALAGILSVILGIIPFVFLPFFSVAANGLMLGVLGAVAYLSNKGTLIILLSLLPHGIVELPAFFYAASLGVYLSLAVLKRVIGKNNVSIAVAVKQVLRSFFAVALPLFLLAAFLEAYVTYAIVSR